MQLHTYRRALVGAAALAVATTLGAPATATPVTATYACKASPPLMAPQYLTQSVDADVVAPTTVAPRTLFDIVLSSAPQSVPAEVSGYTVKEIRNITVKVPVPANSSFVSATISGEVPGAPATWTATKGSVTIQIPGPIAAGASYQIPTVTATLKSGRSGLIETTLGGSSYTNPGLTFAAVVDAGFDVSVPVGCYPTPNPVITTTTITK